MSTGMKTLDLSIICINWSRRIACLHIDGINPWQEDTTLRVAAKGMKDLLCQDCSAGTVGYEDF